MGSSAEEVVSSYFDAVGRRDLDAMAGCWADDGIENIVPMGEVRGPAGVREVFGELFGAFPDLELTIRSMTPSGERVAVHWEARGTFAGTPFQGVAATGAAVEIDGLDLLTVRDGEIVRNDAYFDGAAMARQLGLMPPADSAAERVMKGAFNARTRAARSLVEPKVEPVADGVWVVRGGIPRTMNVYLIEQGERVTVFDAGIASMARPLRLLAARFGELDRIVLGHAHPDHRGAAPGLDAPVWCHPDAVADAEGDGGESTFDYARLRWPVSRVYPTMVRHWDGGPVRISGTIEEGEDVAGFEVVAIPGHAPGQIALWRQRDRLALTSDCFYTLDPETSLRSEPRLPHPAFLPDREAAVASVLKVAALEPSAAWPGHADPVTGDVRGKLTRLAEAG